jgi:hypothetical protein
MTALQALAHSRSRSVGMSTKKSPHAGNDRGSGFPRAAHPAHVVGPSYRHVFDGHGNREYDRESQQQVLRPRFEGIPQISP